jgi:hypothetical protein
MVTGLKNLLLKLKVFWKECMRKSCAVEDDPEKQTKNDINRDLCNWCGSGNEARLFSTAASLSNAMSFWYVGRDKIL